MPVHQKKRKFEMGRQPANTKLGAKRVRPVRGRGGNYKYRALRIDAGNFAWGSEAITRKTRVLDVVYNATNNELVRTKTIVKNCIVAIDANPFRQWYLKRNDVELNKKKIKKAIKLELKPRDQDIFKPSSSTTLQTELLTQRLPINSTLEDFWHAFHHAQVNPADATATSSKVESLNSTKRNSREERSEPASQVFLRIYHLNLLSDHI